MNGGNIEIMNEPEYADIDTVNDTQKPARERKAAPKPESTKHLRTLSNGAIYDMNKGRIVSLKPELAVKNTQITSENASVMQARGIELKRQALQRAANRVAEQGGSVDGSAMTGDLAFVEAIGEAMTMKALSVNDPKAVDAARFLFTETGYSEKQQETQAGTANDAVSQALLLLVQRMRQDDRQVIEGDVSDG